VTRCDQATARTAPIATPPQPGGTTNLPTTTPRPVAAVIRACVAAAIGLPDEVMLVGELIAEANARTGELNPQCRSNRAITEFAAAERTGRARLRSAWGMAGIAGASISGVPLSSSAPISAGML